MLPDNEMEDFTSRCPSCNELIEIPAGQYEIDDKVVCSKCNTKLRITYGEACHGTEDDWEEETWYCLERDYESSN